MSSNLAQSSSTSISQSNILIIKTIKIVEANFDNESDDEPNNLEQGICSSNWPK